MGLGIYSSANFIWDELRLTNNFFYVFPRSQGVSFTQTRFGEEIRQPTGAIHLSKATHAPDGRQPETPTC